MADLETITCQIMGLQRYLKMFMARTELTKLQKEDYLNKLQKVINVLNLYMDEDEKGLILHNLKEMRKASNPTVQCKNNLALVLKKYEKYNSLEKAGGC